MAIDYGDRRIGLALSDESAVLCGEAFTIEEWNMEKAARRIAAEARLRNVGVMVLGLPKNMDGTEGPRAKKAGCSRTCCGLKAGFPWSSGTSGALP
jgi:putative Holliday junction resolvase